MGRRFYWEFESKMKLNEQRIEFGKRDLSYLMQENYEPIFKSLVDEATTVQSLEELVTLPIESTAKLFYTLGLERVVRRRKHPGPHSFFSLASQIGIMSDMLLGMPRTAYKGVVTVYYSGIRIFLVPEGGMSAAYNCDLFL